MTPDENKVEQPVEEVAAPEQTEGKPQGAATIVEMETVAEQFPEHAEPNPGQ